MKTLIDHLAQYAAYHRDPRNIHTHFVGVPMIMFAVVVLLSRPVWWLGMVPVSPALACAVRIWPSITRNVASASASAPCAPACSSPQ